MTADAREQILETIRRRGPIPFDAFMELALYGEAGYFEAPVVGRGRDFVTSPHVHRWFAYGLALALGELRDALVAEGRAERSSAARLVELGAGDGTLARQLLDILADAGPIDYTAVERSARARASLHDGRLIVRRSVDEISELRSALVFANELLDNLPFRRVRRHGDSLVELLVGADGDRLVEVEADAAPSLDALAPTVADGGEAAIPTGGVRLIDTLAERLRDSYVLFIDYSDERGADVHGYRAHRVVENVLGNAGVTDITAGVAFDVVEARAAERGLTVLGRVTQRDALLALGFGTWIERARAAAARLDPPAAARAWAARSRATLLVDPDGLGAHRWLLLATTGLTAPRWLETARTRRSAD